jgi:hypothetical protein
MEWKRFFSLGKRTNETFFKSRKLSVKCKFFHASHYFLIKRIVLSSALLHDIAQIKRMFTRHMTSNMTSIKLMPSGK